MQKGLSRIFMVGFCGVFTAILAWAETPVLNLGGVLASPEPPYYWYDYCNNKPRGSVSFLVESILDELQIDYRLAAPVGLNYPALKQELERLSRGEIDALLATRRHPIPGLVQSEYPVIEIEVSVFFDPQMGQIDSFDSLPDKLALIVHTGKAERYNENLIWAIENELPYRRVSSVLEAYDIMAQQKDVYLVAGRYSVEANRRYQRFAISDAVISLYFAVADRDPWRTLMADFNQILKTEHAAGKLEKLKMEFAGLWLNEEVQKCATNPAASSKGPA